MTSDPKHLLWRLRNNDTAKHLCNLAADRIEALERERDKLKRRVHDQRNMMRAAIGMPPEQYDPEQPHD